MQEIIRPIGVVTSPAPGAAPRGALAQAGNVDLHRPGLLRPRYGHGSTSGTPSTNAIRKLLYYNTKIYAFGLSGGSTPTIHSSKSGSVWSSVTFAGGENSPDDHGRYTHQAAEVRGNLYLTSTDGLQVLKGSADTAAEYVGRLRPPAGLASSSSATPAVYTAGSLFAYRASVVRRDTAGMVTEGPPSGRFYYFDAAPGGAVSVIIPLPNGYDDRVIAGDRLALYRSSTEATAVLASSRTDLDRATAFEPLPYYDSGAVGGLTGYVMPSRTDGRAAVPTRPKPPGEPNDEMRLVREYIVTSTDVSNGYATIVDTVPDNSLGRFLYTSPSQRTLYAENHQPPMAHAVTHYNGCLVLGNIITPSVLTMRLLKVSAANWATGSDAISYSTGRTGNTTSGSPVVTGLSSTTNTEAGQLIISPDFPTGTKVLSVDSGTQITATANATATTVGVAINVHDQITIDSTLFYAAATLAIVGSGGVGGSFVAEAGNAQRALTELSYLMGRSDLAVTANAFEDGGYESDTYTMVLEAQYPGGVYPANVTGTRATAWSTKVALPATGTTLQLESDTWVNAVAWTPPGEPEHWRRGLGATVRLGSSEKRVLALSSVDDTLWVWKEDGLWRGSGDGHEFHFAPFDSSLHLLHPDAVAVLDGVTYAWTNRGVIALTDASFQIISEPISDQIGEIQANLSLYPGTGHGVWVVAYPSERQVHVGVPSSVSASNCAKVWVWHAEAQGWTWHDKAYSTAVWDPDDNLLYYGASGAGTIYKTRRGFAAAVDTYDEAVSVTVSSHTSTSVTFSSSQTWSAGDTIVQNGAVKAVITTAGSGTVAPVDSGTAVSNAAATLARGYLSYVVYQDISLSNPVVSKLFWETSLNFELLEDVYTLSVAWTNDHTNSMTTQTITRTRINNTTFPEVVRTGVPRTAARGSRLRVEVDVQQAGARWELGELGVMYDIETERVRRA